VSSIARRGKIKQIISKQSRAILSVVHRDLRVSCCYRLKGTRRAYFLTCHATLLPSSCFC
jgi:hypothetical protein